LIIYTDGSCQKNGKLDAACGSGIWAGDDHPINTAAKVPGTNQSNQAGEIAAIIYALEKTDDFTPIHFKTDSRYVIDGLTQHLKSWEDAGWIGIANKELFQTAAYLLRKRAAQTKFSWVKGHSGILGNEEADKLADEGSKKNTDDQITTEIPKNFIIQGAKLETITQRLAYEAIGHISSNKPRRQTIINLDITRYAIEELTGSVETDASLWKACRHEDLTQPVKQFLYKSLHGAFKIGEFWNGIPNYEQRSRCPICTEETESMEHILTECEKSHQNLLWSLAKGIWPDSKYQWPEIKIGTILGCGAISLQSEENSDSSENEKTKPSAETTGKSRLLRILISETAHLIWTTRCSHAIGGIELSVDKITTRWYTAIEKRLITDRLHLRKQRSPRKKDIKKVLHTWSGTLCDENSLPYDWVEQHEAATESHTPR
ncbi:ribonuclease H-like protein, partial [Hygrophoropsis aurantiaca]